MRTNSLNDGIANYRVHQSYQDANAHSTFEPLMLLIRHLSYIEEQSAHWRIRSIDCSY